MAESGERRMLFDTRGRRKNVIRVVYAVLALLMGASLFLVVGPFNLGELAGGGGGSSAAEVFDEQIERIEGRLAQNPTDEDLLLALTRARINAGNARIEVVAEGEVPTISPEARNEFEAASETWSRYLEQAGDNVSTAGALLVAGTFFRLAESSTTIPEVEENVAAAARAQRVAAEQSPSVGSLSTLAIYEFFNGNFGAAEKATRQAVAQVPSKQEAESVEEQLDEYRKRAEAFEKQKREVAKTQRETGQEALKNPFSGLGGGALPE